MKVQICYHGNCFDGVLSAAIFSRFLEQRAGPFCEFTFRPMAHGRRDPYGASHEQTFDADINVVVDFRYSPSPRLDWWCDHHQSTFLSAQDEQHFREHPGPQRCFDPTAPSCAGLLYRWLQEEHKYADGFFADHVKWADRIDSARFTSPAEAVELPYPALQLMALLESGPPGDLVGTMIRTMSEASIEDVHRLPAVARAVEPLLQRQRDQRQVFKEQMEIHQGVAWVDLSSSVAEGFNKFIPYYYDPTLRYTVVFTATARRAKVSVGSNPWNRPEPLTNIADLCARYGGGGHPVVGAVTYQGHESARARQTALEITQILRKAG
jgi:hypothetical protein